jgi:hypothetical protein
MTLSTRFLNVLPFLSSLVFLVPHFDFGELEHDEDVFYTPDAWESQEHTCARAVLFLEWLNKV